MHVITKRTLDQLHSFAEPLYLVFLKKMVPSKKEVIGIKAPQLRIILSHIKDATNHLSHREKIDLSIEWVQTNVQEMGQLGYELVGKDMKLLAAVTPDDLPGSKQQAQHREKESRKMSHHFSFQTDFRVFTSIFSTIISPPVV